MTKSNFLFLSLCFSSVIFNAQYSSAQLVPNVAVHGAVAAAKYMPVKSLTHTQITKTPCSNPGWDDVHYLGLSEMSLSGSGRPEKFCASNADCGAYKFLVDPYEQAFGGNGYRRGRLGQFAAWLTSEKTADTMSKGRYYYCSNNPEDSKRWLCGQLPSRLNFREGRLVTSFEPNDQTCSCKVVLEGVRVGGTAKTFMSEEFVCTRDLKSDFANHLARLKSGLPQGASIAGVSADGSVPSHDSTGGRTDVRDPAGTGTGDSSSFSCFAGLVRVGSTNTCSCPVTQLSPNQRIVDNNRAGKQECDTQEQQARAREEQRLQGVEAQARVQAYQDCVDQVATNFVTECNGMAESTVQSCDARKNETAGERAGVQSLEVAKNTFLATKAGTGSVQDCFVAGSSARLAQETMKPRLGDCDGSIEACKSTCDTKEIEKRSTQCADRLSQKITTDIPDGSSAASVISAAQGGGFASTKMTEVRRSTSESRDKCETEGSRLSKGIASVLDGLASSISAAAMCMCKFDPTGKQDCSKLPTQFECSGAEADPRCQSYQAFGACAEGTSSYDQKACECARNGGSSAGCLGGGNLAALNNKQGPTIQAIGSNVNGFSGGNNGGANFGKTPSGKSGGSFDISGANQGDGVSANIKAGGLNSGGGSGGKSGTGVSGGGNGDLSSNSDANAAAGVGVDGDGSPKGFFNSLKTTVGNAFGFGSKKGTGFNNGNGKGAGGKDGFDASRFKPRKLRGVANYGEEEAIGSKNMDIFKMMTLCTSGESCKSNIDGYIKEP